MFQSTVSHVAGRIGISGDLVLLGGSLLALMVLIVVARLLLRKRPSSYKSQVFLFTKTEWRFMRALMAEFERDYLVMSKVRIADLLKVRYVKSRKAWWRAFTRISSKHIDFVLVDPGSGKILCGIELDDPSHNRADRQRRDVFVDGAFAGAKLPLLRVPTKDVYDMAALREEVRVALNLRAS